MPVRANAVAGSLMDPMGPTSTTMVSEGLIDLPVVAGDFARVTVYRRNSAGRVTAREVVHVTSHESGAMTATVQRAREGTIAGDWVAGDRWDHAVTRADIDELLTKAEGETKAGATVKANSARDQAKSYTDAEVQAVRDYADGQIAAIVAAEGWTFADPIEWDAATEYPPRQVVDDDGAWFVALITTTGDKPTTSPTKWGPIPTAVDAGFRSDANDPDNGFMRIPNANAALDANRRTVEGPLAPVRLPGLEVYAHGSDPAALGILGDGNLYGHKDDALHRSTDSGVSWTLVRSLGSGGSINALRQCADGEILVARTTELFRSAGWASDPSTATFSKVLESSHHPATSARFAEWSFDVWEQYVLIGEYGGHGENGARRVWVSENHGATFAERYDLGDETLPNFENAHIHAACIDRHHDASPPPLWISRGDGSNSMVLRSDDLGVTWVDVVERQPTVAISCPSGVVFGTDGNPDGVFLIPRGSSEIVWLHQERRGVTGLSWIASQAARGPRGEVYIVFITSGSDRHAFIVGVGPTGDVATVVHRTDTQSAAFNGFTRVFGVTEHGRLVGRAVLDGGATAWRARPAPLGTAKVVDMPDSGQVLGGRVDGPRSVAVGPGARAGDRGVSVGRGATTEGFVWAVAIGSARAQASLNIAIGEDAEASGSEGAIAIGGANPAVHTGPRASNMRAVAIGTRSEASGSEAVAIGPRALSTGLQSVALGTAEATSASAVAIGRNAKAPGALGAIAIGRDSEATNNPSLAIGPGAKATAIGAHAIGRDAVASTGGVAFGQSAVAETGGDIAVGRDSHARWTRAVAVGRDADASSTNAVALGFEAKSAHSNSIAMGSGTETTAAQQVMIGDRDVVSTRVGGFVQLVSPDGATTRKISIDNAGDLVVSA